MTNDDLIRRGDAIDEFDGVKVDEENCTEYDIGYNDGIDFAVSRLSVLPSAQPERKKGQWEIYVISMLDGEGCKCSECGFEGVPYWDYCPNCGADMRG